MNPIFTNNATQMAINLALSTAQQGGRSMKQDSEYGVNKRLPGPEYPKSSLPGILMVVVAVTICAVIGLLLFEKRKSDAPSETPSTPVKPSKRIGPSDIPPEVCDNGIDDDYDGDADCHDTDCVKFVLCMAPKYKPGSPCLTSRLGPCKEGRWSEKHNSFYKQFCIPDNKACIKKEVCGDMLDNDGDGETDCTDSDCASHGYCNFPENCSDGLDNDGDGDIDCADANCATHIACNPVEVCTDGVDNDGDGFADCADADCSHLVVCNPKLKRKASMKP
ncbi:hypothetical protein ACFL10_01350 [Patescibacteria group bacterium]